MTYKKGNKDNCPFAEQPLKKLPSASVDDKPTRSKVGEVPVPSGKRTA